MLAQQNRLTEKKEFNLVKEKGQIVRGTSFALAFYFRDDTGPSKFGLIVSTKISRNATKRNYIRRALWEALRQNLYQTKKGYDCVLLAQPEAVKKYTDEIMHEVPVV